MTELTVMAFLGTSHPYFRISDIRFPTLPKWFTTPLRAHAKRAEMIHLPDGSSQPSSPTPSNSKDLPHDHALLESLYYSVFEARFVNIRPTGTLFYQLVGVSG